jgi:hypothetical protein
VQQRGADPLAAPVLGDGQRLQLGEPRAGAVRVVLVVHRHERVPDGDAALVLGEQQDRRRVGEPAAVPRRADPPPAVLVARRDAGDRRVHGEVVTVERPRERLDLGEAVDAGPDDPHAGRGWH